MRFQCEVGGGREKDGSSTVMCIRREREREEETVTCNLNGVGVSPGKTTRGEHRRSHK